MAAQLQGFLRVKGKAIPLQAWAGPSSRRLRLPDFKKNSK